MFMLFSTPKHLSDVMSLYKLKVAKCRVNSPGLRLIELQQNSNASSREDYIPKILTVLLKILRVYI